MSDLTAVLQVTHNARSIGGMAVESGGTVRPGILHRSDALGALTEAGIAAFAELGIGTVIDLRTDAERTRSADVLPLDGSVQLITLPILGGAMDEMVRRMLPDGDGTRPSEADVARMLDAVPTLEELYLGMLRDGAAQFVAIGRAVIAAGGTERPGVLFHCTAGKDRTGVAAAILLQLAGASRADIVADYTLTEQNLAGAFAESLTGLITSMGVPLTPKLRILATEAPAEAIQAVLDRLASEYGGAAGYLRAHGMTDAEVDELVGILTSGVEEAAVSAARSLD
jgi:protein-tyrosine phosphatase